MQKILFLCLVALVIFIPYELKHGVGGRDDVYRVHQEILTQEKLNASLENRNSLEQIKIEGLKGSKDSLEARSRYELNLVKPGETLVVLPGNYAIKVPPQKNIK